MKENLTSINVVIDRSGSMGPLTKDTIGGFNSFLKEQKSVPGEATFTLALFSDPRDYKLLYDCVPLMEVQELNDKTYQPSGGTALLDAIGKTIDSTGQKLASLKEEDRPAKVIFLIMTDGEENASREYFREKIMSMINHQRDKYSWEFVFIGANQDAISAGVNLGVAQTASYNYVSSPIGTQRAYASMSSGLKRYRTSSPLQGRSFSMPDPLKDLDKDQKDVNDSTQIGIGSVDIKESK